MAGEQALGLELTAATNTTANGALVALMKIIRSDIIKALQFVDRQRPMPAEADATAKAVAWLMKNKDQLLQVIHDLASPKIEAVPAAEKTLMDVLYAQPSRRPLDRRSTPARRTALMWPEGVAPCCDFASLRCARCVQGIFSRKGQREQEQMNDIMRFAGAHARGPSTSARPRVLLVRHSQASHSVLARARLCEGTMLALPFALFHMHLRHCGCSFCRRSRTRMMHSEPALRYELRCSTYAAHGRFSGPLDLSKRRNGLDIHWTHPIPEPKQLRPTARTEAQPQADAHRVHRPSKALPGRVSSAAGKQTTKTYLATLKIQRGSGPERQGRNARAQCTVEP
jgi:hypothetical protein